MKRSLLSTLVFLIATALCTNSAFALVTSAPCIPDGGGATETFNRPAIDSPGMPTSAQWTGGNGDPQALDVDVWTGSDEMGDGTSSTSGDTASLDVHNSGGNIIGPNGAVVEGGLEGSCVEIIMVWHFKYKATVSVCDSGSITLIGVEGGTEQCVKIEIWVDGVVVDGPKEVCPC